jgi:RNA polymerase sigma factor (TIGR02999 family)
MSEEITDLLQDLDKGDNAALDELMPLVYHELRRIARSQRARLQPGETLDTTALVHEAYLKIAANSQLSTQSRHHFYSLAARVMRQVIVDYARRRGAGKRGGHLPDLSLEGIQLPVGVQTELALAIDQALERLSELDQRLVRVFECRFFVGLSEKETAEALAIPLRTVQRDWMKSKAWLRTELA